jgi:hypothetical protein
MRATENRRADDLADGTIDQMPGNAKDASRI